MDIMKKYIKYWSACYDNDEENICLLYCFTYVHENVKLYKYSQSSSNNTTIESLKIRILWAINYVRINCVSIKYFQEYVMFWSTNK